MSVRVPRLLAISDHRRVNGKAWRRWLSWLADAGVDGLQVREKALDDRAVLTRTRAAREALPSTIVVVNSRADVALAAGAHGVHLPVAEVPVSSLRRRFGRTLLIGRSTHHPDEVAAARSAGADYATFGPVFATPSKARYGPPVGLEALQRAAAHGLPVLALGGITAERLADVAAAGATGASAIGAFRTAASTVAMVQAADRAWGPRPASIPPREPIAPAAKPSS